MSDRMDEERVRKALGSLSAATDRAWQRRECLATARFWKVALELGTYAPREQRHLANCLHCRRREQEVHGVAKSSVPAEAARILVAEQPLKIEAEPPRKAVRPVRPQSLTFPSDPQLSAQVLRDRKGTAILELQHSSWSPATLVRLTIGEKETALSWTWLVPCRAGEGQVTARVVLREDGPLKTGQGFLHVQPVAPPELADHDVPLLCEGMANGSRDALAVAVWQEWGKAVLKADKVAGAVRRAVVQGIRQLGSLPGAGGR